MKYGVCACGKWGEAPHSFREDKHFLKCECGKTMYLHHSDPRDAAYHERDRITPTVIRQT